MNLLQRFFLLTLFFVTILAIAGCEVQNSLLSEDAEEEEVTVPTVTLIETRTTRPEETKVMYRVETNAALQVDLAILLEIHYHSTSIPHLVWIPAGQTVTRDFRLGTHQTKVNLLPFEEIFTFEPVDAQIMADLKEYPMGRRYEVDSRSPTIYRLQTVIYGHQ